MPDSSPHIFLQGLAVGSLIGVYPQERHAPQSLTMDVAVGLPSVRPFQSDRLNDTVDYAAVADLIRQEAGQQSFQLLERLADHLCRAIVRRFQVPWVRIRIVKPDIVPGTQAVGVHYLFQAVPRH
ncbi:MAG: dihydroneopterin aldolase [Lautropia sp.]|nr:dihydroneopterin aldolase [Lautropia sp.]